MTIRLLSTVFAALFLCSACGLIYKQNIQQGNAIEQDDLDELYIGMNRRQVLFVLGTPSIKDPFHQDRWDYVQTFSRRGGDMVQRTVTLRFEDDLLADISGLNNPFETDEDGNRKSGGTIASFVKQDDEPTSQDPNQAALDSAEEEVLDPSEPEISPLDERNATDSEYRKDRDILDQGQDTGPDIDG